MKRLNLVLLLVMLLTMPATLLGAQQGEFLTDEEEEKLREAQDPSQRIEAYLTLGQTRLDRFEEYRSKPADPKYDVGAYLDRLLNEYLALNGELKNWVQYQYDRHGDMRRGLRKLLERGPAQLEALRRAGESPDIYAANYASTLRDAIDSLSDTLDGAAKALGDQEKTLREMKREEKLPLRLDKQRRKEEERRTKQEEKLRRRQGKRRAPASSEED